MLKAVGVGKSYHGDPLFTDVTLTVGPGQRIGLVGPNGAGKSTLLRILAGEELPSVGHVWFAAGTTVGYFAQQVPDPHQSLGAFLREGLGEVTALERQLRHLERGLAAGRTEALRSYGAVQERWLDLRGWTAQSSMAEARHRLGVGHLPESTRMGSLSGGEQARAMLARTVLVRPSVLLLDEPTNHLDSDGIRWLTDYLVRFRGGVVVVTHDRAFLDEVVHRIVELDGIHEEAQHYQGGYTIFSAEKQRRWERLLLDYEAQEKARRRLEEDIARVKAQAVSVELSTRVDTARRYAKKVARKAKSRERRLQRAMRIARPETRPQLTLPLATDAVRGMVAVHARRLMVGVAGRRLLGPIDLEVRAGERILVTGPNGSGKTTLLRVLTGELQPLAGHVERSSVVGLLPQTHDALPKRETVLGYFRSLVPIYEEDAEQVLSGYLFEAEEQRQQLGRISAGEMRRLLLAAIVNGRAQVLLLDEPTNFLDFESLDVVETAVRDFTGAVVMVTHDRRFAENIGYHRRLEVAEGTIEEFPGILDEVVEVGTSGLEGHCSSS